MMKRKDREVLKGMTVPELQGELDKRSKELFRMRFSKSYRQEKNPVRERYVRREVAAINTWIQEKQNSSAVTGARS